MKDLNQLSQEQLIELLSEKTMLYSEMLLKNSPEIIKGSSPAGFDELKVEINDLRQLIDRRNIEKASKRINATFIPTKKIFPKEKEE